MRVIVRGQMFETVRECADHFGVTTDTVYCAISRRDPDSIGRGRGRVKRTHGGGAQKKPMVVAGVRFASMADLARFVGKEPRLVRASLRRGDRAKMRIIQAVMKRQAEAENQRMREALKDWD